jgi:hypothetical protein
MQALLNISLQFGIVMWIVWMIMIVSFARLTSETGMNLGSAAVGPSRGWWQYVETLVFYGIFAVIWSGSNPQSFSTMWFWTFSCCSGVGAGLFLIVNYIASNSTASWKMGKSSNTMAKSVVIAGLIAIVAAALLMNIFKFTWLSMWPLSEWGYMGPWDCSVCTYFVAWNLQNPAGMWGGAAYGTILNYAENSTMYWVKLIVGMIIPVILVFLRGRLSWFRISAAGIAFGVWFGYEFWGAVIIATIIKYTILRIGGTELQTKKWEPFATGMIMGMLLMFLIIGPILTPWGYWLTKPGAF